MAVWPSVLYWCSRSRHRNCWFIRHITILLHLHVYPARTRAHYQREALIAAIISIAQGLVTIQLCIVLFTRLFQNVHLLLDCSRKSTCRIMWAKRMTAGYFKAYNLIWNWNCHSSAYPSHNPDTLSYVYIHYRWLWIALSNICHCCQRILKIIISMINTIYWNTYIENMLKNTNLSGSFLKILCKRTLLFCTEFWLSSDAYLVQVAYSACGTY
jgi:hypothetical protein